MPYRPLAIISAIHSLWSVYGRCHLVHLTAETYRQNILDIPVSLHIQIHAQGIFHVFMSNCQPSCQNAQHTFLRGHIECFIYFGQHDMNPVAFSFHKRTTLKTRLNLFFNRETTNGTQTDHFPTRPNILCVARPTKGQLWNVAVSSSWDGTSAGAATYCLAPSLLLLSCLDANLLLETGGKTSKVGPLRSKYDPLLSIKGHNSSVCQDIILIIPRIISTWLIKITWPISKKYNRSV